MDLFSTDNPLFNLYGIPPELFNALVPPSSGPAPPMGPQTQQALVLANPYFGEPNRFTMPPLGPVPPPRDDWFMNAPAWWSSDSPFSLAPENPAAGTDGALGTHTPTTQLPPTQQVPPEGFGIPQPQPEDNPARTPDLPPIEIGTDLPPVEPVPPVIPDNPPPVATNPPPVPPQIPIPEQDAPTPDIPPIEVGTDPPFGIGGNIPIPTLGEGVPDLPTEEEPEEQPPPVLTDDQLNQAVGQIESQLPQQLTEADIQAVRDAINAQLARGGYAQPGISQIGNLLGRDWTLRFPEGGGIVITSASDIADDYTRALAKYL